MVAANKKLTWSTVKVRLGDLKEWDKNPVKISERDARELAKSIDKYDHVLPYVAAAPVNGRKGLPLLDGHQRKRVELTLRKGVSTETVVDVRVPSRALSEKERAEIAVRLRKNTGEFDDKKLLEWFAADDLMDWGFDQKELEDIGFEFDDGSKDTEPQIDRAEELLKKWKVKPGDLWELGEHRLICGDCTDAAVVARVMGGEKAELEVHDPPYAIGKDYEGENLEGEEFSAFHNAWMKQACEIAKGTETPFYIFTGCKTIFMFSDVIRRFLSTPRLLIWYRPDGHGAGGSDYFYNYDPIFYGSIGGKIGVFEFADFARDVWIANKAKPEAGGFEHSTVKALEVIEQPIKASSNIGGVIVDFFSGSGTTLVACENLSRRCRACEISPAYCAVTLERFYEHTGIMPKLVKDGNSKK
jgi:DNA modification methylase